MAVSRHATGWTYRILYTSIDNRTNSIIVLDNKVTINRHELTVHFGKSAAHVTDYLDTIYNKSLVTINIANAHSITVTNKSNGIRLPFLKVHRLKRFNRRFSFHAIAPGYFLMTIPIHLFSMYSTYNIKMALLKNCLL